MKFAFGQSQNERIEVDVHGYERAPTGDVWDDNWLTVEIRASAGGFRGKVNAAIITGELTKFLTDLRTLFASLDGAAEFSTMEGQISLRLTGDGKGHIELRGEIQDQAGIGNRFIFTLQFDQTQLGQSIHELEQVVLQFPERTV